MANKKNKAFDDMFGNRFSEKPEGLHTVFADTTKEAPAAAHETKKTKPAPEPKEPVHISNVQITDQDQDQDEEVEMVNQTFRIPAPLAEKLRNYVFLKKTTSISTAIYSQSDALTDALNLLFGDTVIPERPDYVKRAEQKRNTRISKGHQQ